jgi:predicted 2-oxoglutarate/Fe(II)-dependent dioxygenase YbiX
MFTVDGVLSPDECAAFIATAEAAGFSAAAPAGPPQPGVAARDSARLAWDDPVLAGALWRILAPALAAAGAPDASAAVGCLPAMRLYRYAPGQRFARHYDDAVPGPAPRQATRHTVLIYLSSCGGGETVFYSSKGTALAAVSPTPGRALVHRHGDDCLLHEGARVSAGTKYVLRTDVVYQD